MCYYTNKTNAVQIFVLVVKTLQMHIFLKRDEICFKRLEHDQNSRIFTGNGHFLRNIFLGNFPQTVPLDIPPSIFGYR